MRFDVRVFLGDGPRFGAAAFFGGASCGADRVAVGVGLGALLGGGVVVAGVGVDATRLARPVGVVGRTTAGRLAKVAASLETAVSLAVRAAASVSRQSAVAAILVSASGDFSVSP